MSKNSIYGLVSRFLGQQNNMSVPVPLVHITGDYSRAWRLFKQRFNLALYRHLPRSQFDEGLRFLRLQISAYTGQSMFGGKQ